jgi:hypothetical protein
LSARPQPPRRRSRLKADHARHVVTVGDWTYSRHRGSTMWTFRRLGLVVRVVGAFVDVRRIDRPHKVVRVNGQDVERCRPAFVRKMRAAGVLDAVEMAHHHFLASGGAS